MLQIRPSLERGHGQTDWLDSHHTFSFDTYHDPLHVVFSSLRVINEDIIAPGKGFGTHPHRDMEIVTYLLSGELEHKDSLGTGSIIRPGEIQKMSAGTGVTHSEFNPSATESTHLLQIWILPRTLRLKPSYEQKKINPVTNSFQLIASPQGGDDTVTIQQDVRILSGRVEAGKTIHMDLNPRRRAWVQVARGALKVNDLELSAGDGLKVIHEPKLTFAGIDPLSEVILFDLD